MIVINSYWILMQDVGIMIVRQFAIIVTNIMLFSKKKTRHTFAVLTLTYDNRPLLCLLVPGT